MPRTPTRHHAHATHTPGNGSVSSVMRTWLSGDIPGALKMAAGVPEEDPAFWTAQAILKGVAFDNGECTLQEAMAVHERALASPPGDVDLLASLLRNQAFFLISINRLPAARGVLRELERLQPMVHPRLRLIAPATRWRLARAEDDYPAQLAAIAEGFTLVERAHAIPVERVGLARLTLHSQRVESALANHDLRVAEADVACVRELQSHTLGHGWWPWEISAASLAELSGQYEAGLDHLRRMSDEDRRPNAKAAAVTEATLLIRLGRLAPADAIIERLARDAASHAGMSEGPAEVAEVDVVWLQGLRAMATRDAAKTWDAAERMTRATQRDHPSWSVRANELLIEAELAAGRAKLARRLLERDDPDQAKQRCRIPWARLHWQEGDRRTAADCFAKVLREVLPHSPGYIARQLQFAMELSAYDAASLWALSIDRMGGLANNEAAPGVPETGTLGRRDRLLRLFDQHRRLTRAQVSALLGCAANTATRDLAALTRAGKIQRVQTSAHLRTSYFVRA